MKDCRFQPPCTRSYTASTQHQLPAASTRLRTSSFLLGAHKENDDAQHEEPQTSCLGRPFAASHDSCSLPAPLSCNATKIACDIFLLDFLFIIKQQLYSAVIDTLHRQIA